MLRIEGTRKDTRVPLWPSLLEDWSPERLAAWPGLCGAASVSRRKGTAGSVTAIVRGEAYNLGGFLRTD